MLPLNFYLLLFIFYSRDCRVLCMTMVLHEDFGLRKLFRVDFISALPKTQKSLKNLFWKQILDWWRNVRLLNDLHNCIIISSRVDYEQMTSCQLTRQLNCLVRLTGGPGKHKIFSDFVFLQQHKVPFWLGWSSLHFILLHPSIQVYETF